jgi:hypothetical protein
MQDGVEADAFVERVLGVLLEPVKQGGLVRVVKRIYDFICKPNESVNGVDGLAKGWTQKPDAHGERRAVRFRRQHAARAADFIV